MTGIGPMEWLKLAIYYASYVYFIAAPLALWLVMRFRVPPRVGVLNIARPRCG